MSELCDLIASHPFLEGLASEHLALLASNAMLTDFKAGEQIFRTGDLANRFYCLLSGEVELVARTDERLQTTIATLGVGDVLGWSWLFPPHVWAFDAVAKEPTRAIFFYGTRLRDQCEQDPTLGLDLMRRMSQVLMRRLQAARIHIATVMSRTAR